jgi:hypothetical protein
MSLWVCPINPIGVLFIGLQTRMTVVEGHNEPFATNGDLLIFPDMVKYK